MKTISAKPETVTRDWYIIDAEGKTLGRLATEIASVLKGKHKPIYTPHVDTGDFVVVINAEKIVVTGNKANQKLYRRHSGYQGGLTEIPYAVMMKKHPERIISIAVRGMIPHNKLGTQVFKKLKVRSGAWTNHFLG